MKKRIGKIILRTAVALGLLAVMALFGFLVEKTYAAPVDQYHSSWHLVRESANEDGATFATVYDLTGVDQTIAGNFASKNTATVINGGAFKITSVDAGLGANEGYSAGTKWMFTISAKNFGVGADNTIDNTLSFTMVGWSKTNGMLQVIANGDCVIGTQAVIIYPDGGDAVGETISMTAVTYTHGSETFSKTGIGIGVAAGDIVYVTGTDITNGYYAVTSRTDDTVVCTGMSSSDNNTDSTLDTNPAFWVDTISLDETTKWTSFIDGATSSTGNKGILEVINSGANEVCAIVADLTGIEWVQFVVYDADATTSDEAGAVSVYGRRYN